MYGESSYLLSSFNEITTSSLLENTNKITNVTSSLANDYNGAVIPDIFFEVIAGFFIVVFVIAIIALLIELITNWKLFKKAGQKGWKSIIPIYNTVILFRIAGISPWFILGYLAAGIPFIGGFIVLGLTIYLNINLAKAFGKGTGFTVGLILLNTIFRIILAFGGSEYQLGKEEEHIETV